jgi:arylsulfatase
MKLAKALAGALAVCTLLVAGVAGAASVWANGYLGQKLYFLALDELRETLGRMLYVLGVWGALFAAILLAARRSPRRPWLGGVLLAALAGLYLLVTRFHLNYRAELVWSEAPSAERAGVVLVFLLILDLVLGKRWCGTLMDRGAPAALSALAVAFLGLNAASLAWFSKLQGELRKQDKPNVLVIAVDALRADHVSALGYERQTTPFLDSLAAGGAIFTQAASNSNATRSTVPSIFTMVHPTVHGLMAGNRTVLSPRFTTLAELLKNQGYHTRAYMPNPPLKHIFNFGQGFDVYDDRILGMGHLERFDSAVPINQKIERWLDGNQDTRFFIYIHYIEPHSPYYPPPAYDRMFYGADAAAKARKITSEEIEKMRRRSGETFELEIPDVNFYVAQYDAEVRYADDQVKVLLDDLKRRGILDHTAVFVTADHGEAFLEHGSWMHTEVPPYEEVTHVPLIAHLPGGPAGLRSDAPVHTFDIAATVLDLLGLKPPAGAQARSFLPILKGQAAQTWEYTLSETPQGRSLRNGRWKFLVLEPSEGRPGDLFDLVNDHGETASVAAQNPELARELDKKLAALAAVNRGLRKGTAVKERDLDDETIKQLKALGYLN